MNTIVYNLETINKAKWNKMAIEKSVACQIYEWALANNSITNEPLFMVAMDKGEWVGGWLIFRHRIPFFSSINIPSEPLIVDKIRSKTITKILWEEIERKNPVYIQWLSYANSRWKDAQFLKEKGFNKIIKYGSHILDIDKTEEDLWRGLNKKHRNVIRKAEKMDIVTEESNDIKCYHLLSEESYKKSGGKGPSYNRLKRIYTYLNPKGMCRVFFAKKDDKIVAGAFMLLCGNRITYLHGATCKNPPTGAANFLHWKMIRLFKTEGFRLYDFGGASLNVDKDTKGRGISRFKERFGGELETFYGGYKVYSPIRKRLLEKVLKPSFNAFFRFVQR